jgi:hypothetical protein
MLRASRHPLLLLLLLALLVSWAAPRLQPLAASGLAHHLVHLQAVAHHHHEDASLHLDETDASEAPHFHAADSAKPLAACADAALCQGVRPGSAPAVRDGPHSLSVVPEALLRPPRRHMA